MAVLLFRFKVVGTGPRGKDLRRSKTGAHTDKYRARGRPIHLIGVGSATTAAMWWV